MNKVAKIERIEKGLALSRGIAIARICMFKELRHSNLPRYHVSGEAIARESNRIRHAIDIAARQLEDVRNQVVDRIGTAEAEIFVAQKMIVQDPTLFRRINETIDAGRVNAETAVKQTLDAYEKRLQEVDDEYIRERATDFGEVRRRILDALANLRPSLTCEEGRCQRGKNRIIVAAELTPSLTVELDTEHTMGFATERGGRNSHAAILARAMGIPAVSGLKGLRDRVSCGDEILINGDTGEVILWPTEATISAVRSRHPQAIRRPIAVSPVPGYQVLANISLSSDVNDALEMQAEGIGLYRTEFELIAAGRMLSEDELTDRYRAVRRAMDGRPVVFRLPDAGSDKPLPFLHIPREDNPALGWRGARLLFDRPEILHSQARAIARVSRDGPVDVLYPMVVDLAQFLRLKARFEESVKDLNSGPMRHGVMLEVPSACLQAKAILEVADFASIGTNDLIQYLFAVDRNNSLVAADYDPTNPILWQVLSSVMQAGADTGKHVTLCGELGADPEHVERLIALGVQTVSMNARSIPAVRAAATAAFARTRTTAGKPHAP